MFYVTGDTHGEIDMHKLSTTNFPEQHHLTLKDYMIIAGDFGGIWTGNRKDNWLLDWHNDKNYTTLFVDGNHENFDALERIPVDEWNGGKVRRVRPNVLQLMRGQVFNIDGKKFFTFGGAMSHDKQYRTAGLSWWEREIPSEAEFEEAKSNLSKHNWKVDYIITHTCPTRLVAELGYEFNGDKVCDLLSLFDRLVERKLWVFGHFHRNVKIENFYCLYDQIAAIKER